MIFDIKEVDGGMQACIKGRLDTPAAVKAQQEIEPLLQNADKAITLDCSELEYISSSGLRILLGIRKNASAVGSKVKILNLSDDIRKVFNMTGFSALFDI